MAVKRTGQPSFMEALLPKGSGANAALDRLAGLVKWYRFEKLLAHLRDEEGPGRPGYPVLVLFRGLLLQSLYVLARTANSRKRWEIDCHSSVLSA